MLLNAWTEPRAVIRAASVSESVQRLYVGDHYFAVIRAASVSESVQLLIRAITKTQRVNPA